MKNSEDETPLALAKKLGNDAVAKALKNFGTRPQPLARSTDASSAVAVKADVQNAVEEVEDLDENVEPARTCFPDAAFNRDTNSKDRVHVMAQRLLAIARKMMQMCLKGNAPLMRQGLLEWTTCMQQCVQLTQSLRFSS